MAGAIEEFIIYCIFMLFVLSTVFTLVFVTTLDEEIISERFRRRLMIPLYIGYTYLIASLTGNSFGLVMLAYVPALIATIFSDWRTASLVAFMKPLENILYLKTAYGWSEIPNIWISVLISWTALIALIVSFQKFKDSKIFYIIIAIGFGALENLQSAFYPRDVSAVYSEQIVNILSYVAIIWFALVLKDRLMRYENKMTDELLRDPLTSVYNLKAFNEHKVDEEKFGGYALGVMDIDKFKRLNDTLGHSAGNDIIQLTADTLLKTLDKHYLPDEYKVYRFGGEEFIVLILLEGDVHVGMVKFQKVLEEANNVLTEETLAQFETPVAFSGGITGRLITEPRYSAFRRADILLYEMKNNTPGMVAIDTEVDA